MYLHQLEEHTGLSAEALEEKAHGLQAEVARLEPLAKEVGQYPQQLKKLEKQRQGLRSEVSRLEKQAEPLRSDIVQKEKRAADLSKHVSDLEQRAQAADERLAVARGELQALAGLGLSSEDLQGLTQRVAGVAQRHGIRPAALRDRLLHDLEELDAGLGLESLLKLKQGELDGIKQAIAKAQRERVALDSAQQDLRQQQANLQAAIGEEEAHVCQEMQAIAEIAEDAVSKLQQDLAKGMAEALLEVQKLRSEALELGQEMGRYDAMVEVNQWLQTLVGMVWGDGGMGAADVRVVALAVLRGVKNWTEQNQGQTSLPYSLTTQLDAVIKELQQWKV